MSERLHAGPRGRASTSADRRRQAAIVAVVAVLLGAILLAGYAYARRHGLFPAPVPTVSATPRPSASPGTTITLPDRFGDYQRDGTSTEELPVQVGDDLATASGYYRLNGVRSVLIIGAAPVGDLETFLLSVGLSGVQQVGEGYCGRYSGVQLCSVLTGSLAVGAVGLTGQSRTQLVALARQARDAF